MPRFTEIRSCGMLANIQYTSQCNPEQQCLVNLPDCNPSKQNLTTSLQLMTEHELTSARTFWAAWSILCTHKAALVSCCSLVL